MRIIGNTYSANYRPDVLAGESAYMGSILHVDLSSGDIWVDQPDDDFYRTYIGGRGVILYYLLKHMQPNADPLGPENLLIFAPGLFTGTQLPGAGRHAVGAKSPLTGALGSGEAGGWFGAELKRAGFDAVVIRGRSDEPVYLWIHNGHVEVRSAGHLWGKSTSETQNAIHAELSDEKIRTAVIGLAGEKLVRYAAVMHDINRAAGRSGLGAVMGSKNLKAVAVRGSLKVGLADKSLMDLPTRWITKSYKTMMGWAVASGTSGSVQFNHDGGATGVKNYLESALDGIEQLDGAQLIPSLVSGRDTCSRCPVQCKLVIEYTDEDRDIHIDGAYGGPEYETIGAVGPLCQINDPVFVAKAHELCTHYGLDTISTGGTIAFTMEAAEKGLLEGFDFLPAFGDGASLLESIHRIAARTGVGDWMAEGSARMADRLGADAVQMLAVARGQELPLHDPRLKHTMALGYALSATGADHMHNLNDTFASFDAGDVCARLREMGMETPLELWGISDHKLKAFYYETAFKNFLDSAVICHFYPYEYRHMVDALNAAGGWKLDAEEINQIGTRIITLARLFLLREGFTAEDDALSARAFYRLNSGPIAGKALTEDELKSWLHAYYKMMGWDEQGRPDAAILARLDLLPA
jgi:aldehyde:ferredoxin oxidoreductase